MNAASAWRRLSSPVIWASSGAACLALGCFVAWHHPLWPGALVIGVLAWAAMTFRHPGWWLLLVPALLPVMNFSPWTGWLGVDEFDLLLLGTLAGGHARLAFESGDDAALARCAPRRWSTWPLIFYAAAGSLALVRGLADAGWNWPSWFQGYADPLNSVRASKSWFFVAMLLPMLRRELAVSVETSVRRLSWGMWISASFVAIAVFRERMAYPGWLDFSSPYRITALFWEMHVGGAAIDVYVAMAVAFAAWAVWSAGSWKGWAAAAALTLAWGYVCLTTFSRGVYLGAVMSLSFLALVLWIRRFRRQVRWRRMGDLALGFVLLSEVALVIGSGSFIEDRLAASDHDFVDRLVHWRAGVRLLHTPADWVLGIGAGRLPARSAAEAPGHEFSGEVRVFESGDGSESDRSARPFARLSGPRTQESLGGYFGLTQRVPLLRNVRYSVELSVRASADTDLRLLVCEMHLLYRRRCQRALLPVRASESAGWRHVSLPMVGGTLDPGHWFAPREGLLVLSVRNAGGVVDVTDVGLHADGPESLLLNGDFAEGQAHWFPSAQRYFLPWHIDNLYLETLIERGFLGVLALASLIGAAFLAALRGSGRQQAIAPFLAASLTGALVVGLVSSVMDVPRVAFLFCFLASFACCLPGEQSCTTPAPQ